MHVVICWKSMLYPSTKHRVELKLNVSYFQLQCILLVPVVWNDKENY